MDGRRARGDRTRAAVARRAAERASIDGLSRVSLGQIASDLGISKSGIQAVYPSKEDLQLATVAAATSIFVDSVVKPSSKEPHGIARLRALIDRWLSYVGDRVLPGGCFLASTIPEFDSHPGPVRDALSESRKGWLSILEREVRTAQDQGEIDDAVPADLLAFEIDALLTMGNTACNLAEQPTALRTARRLIDLRLGGTLGPRGGRSRT
jgi:AcrR family transcriptional regulator